MARGKLCFSHFPIDLVPAAQSLSVAIRMTNTCSSLDNSTPLDESLVVINKRQWNVQASEFSKLCSNPIREIVDNIKKPAASASTKKLIPLSLGTSLLLLLLLLFFPSRCATCTVSCRRDTPTCPVLTRVELTMGTF